MEEIIARKSIVLAGVLNERQRRLWAAAETLSLGHGGLSLVSRATGISRVTIHQGLKELTAEQQLPAGRVRRSGGGRKKTQTAGRRHGRLLPHKVATFNPP